MAKKQENTKAIKQTLQENQLKFLQETWYEGYWSITGSRMKKEGFDTSQSTIILGNFKLTAQLLLGGYDLSLVDKTKDLENKPIVENSKFLKFLQNQLKQGITEINEKDLQPYKINHKLGKVQIENVIISQIGIGSRYRIELVDNEKGLENKVKDGSIDIKKVLEDFTISAKDFKNMTELDVNKNLETHFRKYFENAHKSSGNLRGAYDLELGKSDFVIEIKMASALKKTDQKDRASGQIKRYLSEFKKNNFLMLVVGTDKEKVEKNVLDLEKEVLKDFKCYFYYLEVE